MCNKCQNTGKIITRAFAGAYMFSPCDCEAAKEKQHKAKAELVAMLLEIERRTA